MLGVPKRFQAELAVRQLTIMSTGGWTGTLYVPKQYVRTHVHTRLPLTRDYVYYICIYTYMFVYTFIYISEHTVRSTIILHNIYDMIYSLYVYSI